MCLSVERPVFIRQVELRELRMRLVNPFETSFGTTTDRRIVILKVLARTPDAEYSAYGEVTAGEGPYYSHETYQTAWHILSDFIVPQTIGKEIASASDFAPLARGIRGHRMAQAGLETALWDLEAKTKDLPLWRLLGGTRKTIDCGVSIGIQPSVDMLLVKIQAELDAGYRRIKIKIRPGWDLQVIMEVRRSFPKILLMVDANSAYTLADLDLFRKLDEYDLMMIEQPLHDEDIIDHSVLQRHIQTPICLDESIHSVDDARKAIQIRACQIINIKLGRVGGHRAVRAIHDLCRDSGIPVWCGGMLESGIGRAHNIAMSSLENFSLPGDVTASKRYWEHDIIEPEVIVGSDGRIAQRTEPGIGYRVNEDLMGQFTVRSQVFTA
jgi:o-succinylbenzoate synthase